VQTTSVRYGDGDKDGKPDIWHNNRGGSSPYARPGAFVWEFKKATIPSAIDTRPIVGDQTPATFDLSQNYPNPFNPSTTIHFDLSKASRVQLNIYDLTGRLVKTLLDEVRPAGSHQVIWNGTDRDGNVVATGVYFYSLNNQTSQSVRKMMLVK